RYPPSLHDALPLALQKAEHDGPAHHHPPCPPRMNGGGRGDELRRHVVEEGEPEQEQKAQVQQQAQGPQHRLGPERLPHLSLVPHPRSVRRTPRKPHQPFDRFTCATFGSTKHSISPMCSPPCPEESGSTTTEHLPKGGTVFVAFRDIRFAKGRFALMGSVIALITLLIVLLSGLTAGLAD